MSSRPSAAELARMQAFLTELLDREILGMSPLDVRLIQEQFWTELSAHLRVNPMSSGLEHLDQLARDTMDAQPDISLQGTVLVLPTPPAAAAPSPAVTASESSKGKAPARSKRKSPADAGKAPAKKPRAAAKPKPTTAPASDLKVESKPLSASTSSPAATPLADALGVSSMAPDVVRQAIEAVLRKAQAQGKSPCRITFPWSGRPLWYDPVAHPDVHRAHWRFWMLHRRAFWDWAFHAPLEPSSLALANRRKIKLRAVQARWVFISFCIETWGFYDFMARLDEHPQLFWFGGPPGRTSNSVAQPGTYFAEDLDWLATHDPARYQATLENALDPDSIDAFGYPNMRALLGTTGALLPQSPAKARLTDRALARVRFDLSSSRKPKDTWAGPITDDPWHTLVNSTRIKTVQAQVVSSLIDGTYVVPTSKTITKAESRHADYSDLDENYSDDDEDSRSTKSDPDEQDDEEEDQTE